MKKVLILSYYFPPCNLTPSERIYSWAKYLNERDIYPIIITRNWDLPIKGFSDELKSSGTAERLEKRDGYEVWYLPYKQSYKESLYDKRDLLSRFLYFSISILNHFKQIITFKGSPFDIFLNKADELLKNDKNIKALIVSVYPHAFFEYANLLHNKYGIAWIADYRDDWTSNEIINRSIVHRFFNYFNSFNEKKWLSSASFFISVSDFYVQKIKKVIGNIPGYTIPNGYMKENYNTISKGDLYEKFTITYVGSLYHNQPFEEFMVGLKLFIDKQNNPNFRLLFVGLKNNLDAYTRIKKMIKGYEKYVEFTERLPKDETIEIQNKSHVLLSCTYNGMKGIPGSKLYEYIVLKKAVLIFPGDNDIIEESLKSTKQGIVARNESELCEKLSLLYSNYLNNIPLISKINVDEVEKFDRHFHAIKLGELINNI